MYGWAPLVLLMFLIMPPRRAVITAFLAAWLFLPMASYSIEGLPDWSKMTATSFGVMAGVLLFDPASLSAFRAKIIDLPIIVWCLTPFIASVTNGFGVYDGVSAIVFKTIIWGLPYFIGRLYFSDLAGLRELAVGVFVGGLVYAPFCIIEVVLSPQLHRWVYGYHQHQFAQTMRLGGYRPMVFMQHGLAVGMFMISASLAGIWLWKTRSVHKVQGIPIAVLLVPLLIVTIAIKSLGALILLAVGLMALAATRYARTRALLIVLAIMPPLYIAARGFLGWSGRDLTAIASLVSADRAASLEHRMVNEDMLTNKAKQKMLFGWASWGGSRVYNEEGKDISTTDGMWIVAFGNYGVVGLSAFMLFIALPAWVLLRRARAPAWASSQMAPAAICATLLLLYSIDNVLNAMINPIFVLMAGGVGGLVFGARTASSRRASRSQSTFSYSLGSG